MPLSILMLILLALSVAGFLLGRARSIQSGGGDARTLHSRPNYYGASVVLSTAVPACLLLLIWLIVQPLILGQTVQSQVPPSAIPEDTTLSLMMSDVRRVADGLDVAVLEGAMTAQEASTLSMDPTDIRARLASVGVALGSNLTPEILTAAQSYRALSGTWTLVMTIIVIALALVGFFFSWSRIHKDYRARNAVEAGIRALLVLAASLAILTTIGILLSLVFNTVEFFRLYPARDFFGSFTWSPSFGGGSQLGILPLLWGTLYISLIALAVAVPIGLFAAIYLSEYAGSRLRAFAKPLIEILAGHSHHRLRSLRPADRRPAADARVRR